ncbi:MAG: hypothetical protein U9Q67_04660 [Patescibacteria group bacterium]|nr:hypothetical protein [Patescibacteria group bacterium]
MKKKTKSQPKHKQTKSKRSKKRTPKSRDPKTVVFKRSLFYSVCLFALYQFMIVPLRLRYYPVFWLVSLAGFGAVVAMLLYSGVSEYYKSVGSSIKHIRKKVWLERTVHHMIMPILLYTSGVLFLFFNNVRILDQMAVITLTGLFGVLLHNISTTYLKQYSISRKTLYIFDFINIITFYFAMDVLMNLVIYEGGSIISICIGSGIISSLLIGMMLAIARQISSTTLILLLVSSVIVGLASYVVLLVPIFSISVLSLVVTVVFYLVDVFFHHKLDGSYNWDIMSQYILFAIMAIILLLYL